MLKSLSFSIKSVEPAQNTVYTEFGFDVVITCLDKKQYVLYVDYDDYLQFMMEGYHKDPQPKEYNLTELKQKFDKVIIRHYRRFIGMDGPAYGTRFTIESQGLFADEDGSHRYTHSVLGNGGITEVILVKDSQEYCGDTVCLDVDQYNKKYGRNLAIERALQKFEQSTK